MTQLISKEALDARRMGYVFSGKYYTEREVFGGRHSFESHAGGLPMTLVLFRNFGNKIIIAADSRMTFGDGSYADNSQKIVTFAQVPFLTASSGLGQFLFDHRTFSQVVMEHKEYIYKHDCCMKAPNILGICSKPM